MNAISVIQPWAWLLAIGLKRYETRSWGTRKLGTYAIHASRRTTDSDDACEHLIHDFYDHFTAYRVESADDLAYGAVIGTAQLIACHYTYAVEPRIDDQERAFGDFSIGRFAWEFRDAVLLPTPIPYRGMPGVWEFPSELITTQGDPLAQVERAVGIEEEA